MDMQRVRRDEMQEISDFLRPIFLDTYEDKVINGRPAVERIFDHWDTLEPLLKKFDSGVEYFVHRDEGAIVCLVALKKEEDGIMYIDKLYVSQNSQGKGYGTKAMEFAFDYSREQGSDIITTHSNAANLRAINHYGKFGMNVVATVHRIHDGGEYDYAYLVGKL